MDAQSPFVYLFRFRFAKLYMQINKRKFWINFTKFYLEKVKVQISCADQSSNCISGKTLQIIYSIKFSRDKMHTIFSMKSIDVFLQKIKNKKKNMNTKIKNIRIIYY